MHYKAIYTAILKIKGTFKDVHCNYWQDQRNFKKLYIFYILRFSLFQNVIWSLNSLASLYSICFTPQVGFLIFRTEANSIRLQYIFA